METVKSERRPDKREKYAKFLTQEEAELIWSFLEKKFGIKPDKYTEFFNFAQNRRGRLWIVSKKASEFVTTERFDPAKVLTCAIGKSDSQKLLHDNEMHVRLTIDGAMFFNSDITKNILYLSEEEEELWYTGEVINRTESDIPNDVYVLAKDSTKDIIGSTISKNGFLLNFVPKWRRPDRLSEVKSEPENYS